MKFFILGVILLTFVLVPQADALRNDSIETIGFWDEETIDVTLMKNTYTNNDRIEQVTKAVTSQEFYNIEDNLMHKDRPGVFSPYYLGWQGALDNSNSTLKNLNFDVSRGGGDIIISLTTQSHPDGFSGKTWPLFYDGKIVKANITIYDVDKLSNAMLYTIVLHEMGHALGIGHTTADEELMYPVITTPYPYVSPCTMQALQIIDQGKTELRCNK